MDVSVVLISGEVGLKCANGADSLLISPLHTRTRLLQFLPMPVPTSYAQSDPRPDSFTFSSYSCCTKWNQNLSPKSCKSAARLSKILRHSLRVFAACLPPKCMVLAQAGAGAASGDWSHTPPPSPPTHQLPPFGWAAENFAFSYLVNSQIFK